MTRIKLEELCREHDIDILVGESKDMELYEVELEAPDGHCFQDGLHWLVHETGRETSGRMYKSLAYVEAFARLPYYLPILECGPGNCECEVEEGA